MKDYRILFLKSYIAGRK